VDAPVGIYDVRVGVTDKDNMFSGYIVFPNFIEVLNNRPTAPEIRLDPVRPVTTSTLQVAITNGATDVETGALTYRYRWFKDGVLQENLTSDIVLSIHTSRGQNWSVEVCAFDGLDAGMTAIAWRLIENSPPTIKTTLPNPEMKEDTVDDQWLNLANAFEDPDRDVLTWTVNPAPQHITVTIDPSTGKVTLHPEPDWNGDESVTFVASDGQLSASQTVLVTVTAVDDPPVITTVNDQPIASDPITFSIDQGELLVIQLGTSDVEGDELSFSVNSTAVQIDETTGELRFQPGNDVIGTIRFAVTMTEVKDPSVKVKLNFAVTVVNVNDPPADPQITSPRAGVKYKVDTNLTLVGLCTDPDTVYGQVLNYTWSVNGTPRWYGPSVTVSFGEPGNYTITLTVSDGEFQRSASVGIEVTKDTVGPPPVIPPEREHKETPYALIVGVIVAVCVIMLVAFLLVSRRRAAELEAADETEEKREDYKRMAAEVKATADQMEREVAVAKAAAPPPVETMKIVTETRGPDGKVVISSTGVPEQTLAVQPKETEAPSADVQKLFKEMETKEPQVSAEEAEAMRVESLKRKYQNAIGRLPYGIPAAELKGKEWTWLAAAMATGQKKDTPDGREVTLIEGRWYFSDVKDASSFLTEHGARPKVEPKKAAAAPAMDKATILAKLEERLAMGEISEETYQNLRRKYED
jgi:uncharacterized membrane protein